MEKKKQTIVSKLAMAALIWAASSGGLAWGQVLKKQQNPPMQLRGGIGGGIDANGSGQNCSNNSTVRTSFTVENNYGPGETGVLTPKTGTPDGSKNTGRWNTTDQIFVVQNGRITLGGTMNHVGHRTTGANYSGNLAGHGTSTGNVVASQNLQIVTTCDDHQTWTGTASNPLIDGITIPPATGPGIQMNGTTASLTRSWGPATVSISTPVVPDGSGVMGANADPVYTNETQITVDGSSMTSDTPWWLQQFYFMSNPWYFYNTSFTYPTVTHTVSFTYTTRAYNCVTHGIPPNTYTTTNWGAITSTSASASGSHQEVAWNTSNNNQGGFVDARIIVTAGSDIRLEGTDGAAKSIAAGAPGGGETFSLDLPATHYTLMNDADVAFTNITVSNRAPLGVNAVFGVNTQLDTDISTDVAGGTILIGSATDAASQGFMTIPAPTSGVLGNPKTFAKSTVTGSTHTYTGFNLPLHGTANFGNYGENAMTIRHANPIPATLANGGYQLYNHSCNTLAFDVPYVQTVGGTGNLLLEAYQTLSFPNGQTSTLTGSGAGHATLNGGDVNIQADHTYTGSAAGDYGIYAYTPTKTDAKSWAALYANPSFCGTFKGANLHVQPLNETDNTGAHTNYKYGGDIDDAHDFCGAGNIIFGAVTVNATHSDAGDLRWQATNDIRTDPASTIGFTHSGTGETHWQAKHDINAGGNVTFTVSGDGKTIWQAENDINTLAPTTTKVSFPLSGSALTAWQATRNITTNNEIEFNNTGTGNVFWQAGNNIATNFKVNFTNTQSANTMWYAKNNITTTGGDGTLGNDVTFNEQGTGNTLWWAEGGNITTNNNVQFNHDANSGELNWYAGNNIVVSGTPADPDPGANNNQLEMNKESDNRIELHTVNGYIRTNAQVDINRTNAGAGETYLWAGCQTYTLNNNIDIENVFNYTETAGQVGGLVKWYAENDILSNTVCDNNRPAPITFTVPATSTTTTLWEAERNINTKGRVDFKYGGVTAMGPLTWLSRGGYIQTERPVTVAYESDSTISFRAEDDRHDLIAAGAAANADAGGRRGNIHFFDSVDINRNNPADGLTEIKAENHIWTAMLNYVDQQSTGNSMDIISHKGDIYLGYNDGTTSGFDWKHYVANSDNWKITQQSPSATCAFPAANPVSYDLNRFTYTIPASNQTGHLWIKAGWEEETDYTQVADDGSRSAGGNIYFTHLNVNQPIGSIHPTEITIPFSGLWRCGAPGDSSFRNRAGDAMQYYENAGIIAGVSRCVVPYPSSANTLANDTSLIYRGGIGNLKVDAGLRGNIIINKGAYLNFQDSANMTGDATFRTRFGDIDMRDPFNVDSMRGGLLFLAQTENLGDLSKVGFCGCAEERNNVYLQDFQYQGIKNGGSVFVGADNNIKLNYGGLQNKGTRYDPFLSTDYKVCPDGKVAKVGSGYLSGGGCGNKYHCDMDTFENQARDFVLNFYQDKKGDDITSGGFAAVASDYIDVYKNLIYTGGSGSGMSTVPGTGTLHGESVAGYGLYMKTQANKNNWNTNIFFNTPKCPTDCSGFNCNGGFLHMVSRMTFHADARIYAHNQKVYLGSPVIESFGPLVLNADTLGGGNTKIVLQADSLILHDSLVLKGTKTTLRSWSGLKGDRPVMKFGFMRRTPPFTEYKVDDCSMQVECAPCYYYIRGSKDPLHMLDTITIKFEKGASLERLNTTVFDHTVLTFLTDSFDHKLGNPVLDAKIFVDTLKVRNQVDLFADKTHGRDAHFELISEEQMFSKSYAGVYTKHYHMEPIGACGRNYSELWPSDDLALDVITTSIFGGFGYQHSDVHVENMANLNPGFTSLRLRGQCYEQKCGTLTMKDLRLDGGAQLHFSVGTTKGINGEYSDAIDVEKLTTYGKVDINIEVRPCERMEKRCYPIIYYKSQTKNSLGNLTLATKSVKIDGIDMPLTLNTSTPGVVYVCIGNTVPPSLSHSVTIPSVAGVTTDPAAGIVYTPSGSDFSLKATYMTDKPMVVRTNRVLNGVPEVLTGVKNANGEYEYVIHDVRQHVMLSIGPDFVANTSIDGTAVWSHGETIYIRVEREDIASIYSVAGQLVKRIELPEGDNSIPMQRGVYVVTLKDGSIHKVIVK